MRCLIVFGLTVLLTFNSNLRALDRKIFSPFFMEIDGWVADDPIETTIELDDAYQVIVLRNYYKTAGFINFSMFYGPENIINYDKDLDLSLAEKHKTGNFTVYQLHAEQLNSGSIIIYIYHERGFKAMALFNYTNISKDEALKLFRLFNFEGIKKEVEILSK